MKFTDLFIRRPVMASVLSLILLLLGLNGLWKLQLREYPQLENAVINIQTSYPGASSKLVQGFITSPIQQAVASAEGIDYLTSNSTKGSSTIQAHLKLGFDSNKAMTEILAKVAEARRQLPEGAQEPVITKSTGDTTALMYLSFYSNQMSEAQITDYLKRVVQPQLETLDGVSQAQILGEKTFAMRIWLNPKKLAAYNLSPQDVAQALKSNSYQTAAGQTKGKYVAIDVEANTDLHSVSEFRNLVVKRTPSRLVRLKDVATVELGAENYDSAVYFNGKRAVFIAINALPDANPLDVIDGVYKKLPEIQSQMPSALNEKVAYDATKFIRDSIDEVIKTVGEATVIVIFVIFLFLGSVRSVLVPVVTIPLSLVGVCFFMLMMGYSINLLTLLAMVLAIGLVVDDAIVVVENIHRHIEEGHTPFRSALLGAREIASPVIAMSLTLAAVYAPIGFIGGLTGGLFKEFAFALAGSVLISGFIALTLSPMMCSKLLTAKSGRLADWLDRQFDRLRAYYQRRLHSVLDYRPVTLVMVLALLGTCAYLYTVSPKTLARPEDQGIVFSMSHAPQTATLNYLKAFTPPMIKALKSFKEGEDFFIVEGMNNDLTSTISGLLLKPWSERNKTQMQLVPEVKKKLDTIPGFQSVSFNLPTLPGASGLPIQFVLVSSEDYKVLYQLGQDLIHKAMGSGKFIFLRSSLDFNRPAVTVQVDRAKANELGLSMQDIGQALTNMLSEGYVNRFSDEGRSYKIIPQAGHSFRDTVQSLEHYYVRTDSGQSIPLSTVTTLKHSVEPNQRTQFQQLNSLTIEGVARPGVSMGEALGYLRQQARANFPKGVTVDYAGQSRQFMQEGNALLFTFLIALILIYLVLAAQFESFRDPLTILIAVPMSLFGALLPIAFGLSAIDIYTEVGLVTLIGLISKHGILIVQFANQLQREQGLDKRQAVEQAAGIRLRAILMTTASMVVGVVPLIIATGAGAASRFDIGLVIASGLGIGTCFTLFVVPTIYLYLAGDHRPKAASGAGQA